MRLTIVNRLAPFPPGPDSEEEPVVVPVGVDIVLDHQVVLPLLLITPVRTAKIATLEVGVNAVVLHLLPPPGLELLKILPVIVDQRIDPLQPSQEGLIIAPVTLQFVV